MGYYRCFVGMISANQINQTGIWNDYKEFFTHIDEVIAEDNRPVQYSTNQLNMTQTGLSKILEDVSDAIYLDLLNMMPISLFLTVLIITLLHKSWKVVIISGTPIVMALAVTFGAVYCFTRNDSNTNDYCNIPNSDWFGCGLCFAYGEPH